MGKLSHVCWRSLDKVVQNSLDAWNEAGTLRCCPKKLLQLGPHNGRVDIDKDDPDDVAGSFLRDNDLI